MENNLLSIVPLWVVLLPIGVVVYWREPHKAANRTFVTFVLMLVFWSWCVRVAYFESFWIPSVWWERLAFVGTCLAITSFLMLAQSFPDLCDLVLPNRARWLVWCGVGVCGLSLTPWLL